VTEHNIIAMQDVGDEYDGKTITVVGIPSHRTTNTEDAYGRVWLQDGVAVEVLFDEDTWKRHESDLIAAAVLVRGRVEWYPAGCFVLMRLCAEYVEPRELVSIQTEGF
jgi:hypothetical protein